MARTSYSAIQLAEEYYSLALKLMEKKRYADAVRKLRKAISLYRDNHLFHYKLGNALFYTGKYLEAIEEFDVAISINPGYINAHYNKGVILMEEFKWYEYALEEFDKVISLDQNDVDAHRRKADCLYYLGRYEEAAEEYTVVMSFDRSYW
ncbi:tetratricopeptide repeat protein [Metallosphaera javensis (ex Sakai et al. 2022)]|uniref:tetratricopeptide repeat protein n=1 Tax=Metallosphaera javensis (ex Sakai et al. 2022) TaxID=2775498 RepID=UPI002585D6D3|nr:MAG: hypothetical protein MjAS7_1966 [Metallosphaera javensis (ex Sakai et al. 2022)]